MQLLRQAVPFDYMGRSDLLQEVRSVPEESDGKALEDEDHQGGDCKEQSVSAENVESDLESTTVHSEHTAVEEEYGDFDKTEAGTLKDTNRIGGL